jgi:hypothetical protein
MGKNKIFLKNFLLGIKPFRNLLLLSKEEEINKLKKLPRLTDKFFYETFLSPLNKNEKKSVRLYELVSLI